MQCDVDGDLAGHHVTLLPGRDQLADRLGGTADHRGLRRGHYRHHDVLDAAHRQLRKHLLGRQFHRCHGADTGDAGHQPRAAADDAQAVFQRQRTRDDSRRGLAQRMPDDRARAHAVCLQGGGQRDLHGEQTSAGRGRYRSRSAATTSRRSPRTRTRGRSEARLARPWPQTPVRSPAAARPSPPTVNPDRKTPTPDPGRRVRSRPRYGESPSATFRKAAVSSGWLRAMTAVRSGRCARRRARV